MKLLPVWLFVTVRSGRPSSHGALFSTDLADRVDSGVDTATCFPQNTQIDGDWKRQCITAPECCSGRITKSATRGDNRYIFVCGCIPAGKPFNNGVSECCSGEASPKDPAKCGCLAPNTGPQQDVEFRRLKLNVSDCCHAGQIVDDTSSSTQAGILDGGYPPSEFKKCGPRICQAPGLPRTSNMWWKPKHPEMAAKFAEEAASGTGICCGGAGAGETLLEGNKVCKCIPAGTVTEPHRELVLDAFCCSGKYAPGTKTCGCIPDSQALAGFGPTKTDCCSKETKPHEGSLYCKEQTCTRPHNQIVKKGDWCCTDKKYTDHLTKPTDTTWCPCVKGGATVDAGDADYCCSGQVDRNNKCTWINYDYPIRPEYMTEDECFSGREKYHRCLCMKPGDSRRGDLSGRDRGECCSGGVYKKKCSCIAANNILRKGAIPTDCCSNLAEGDVCQCAPISSPMKETGMIAWDCCSSKSHDGFCSCVPKGVQSADPSFCCAPPHKDANCGCKKAGAAVPASSSATASCCSGTSKQLNTTGDDGHCATEVCS